MENIIQNYLALVFLFLFTATAMAGHRVTLIGPPLENAILYKIKPTQIEGAIANWVLQIDGEKARFLFDFTTTPDEQYGNFSFSPQGSANETIQFIFFSYISGCECDNCINYSSKESLEVIVD